jgi:hypothetical protein
MYRPLNRRAEADRRTPTAERRQTSVASLNQGFDFCFEGSSTGHFRRSGRQFPAATAASAARQSRPPAPLYSQTGALYSLRTNIPSCKNADVESPTLKYPERTLCKKIWRKPNKKSQ